MSFPTGFSQVPGFLAPIEQEALLRQIRLLPFVQDRMYGLLLKRRYSQFGLAYVSAGRKLAAAPPFPDFLIRVVDQARAYTPAEAEFDQCIITHYPAGAGIGWHTDASRFGDTILAVSLAGSAKLRLRPNGAAEHTHESLILPGSLYVLQGPAR